MWNAFADIIELCCDSLWFWEQLSSFKLFFVVEYLCVLLERELGNVN